MNDLLHGGQRFAWPARVYYEDTDSAGVVYYANYLRYFERARTEWLRALGFEQTDLAARHHVLFVVRSISVEYLRPARFNDELQITVEPSGLRASQIVFAQRVIRGTDMLTEAQVRVACLKLPGMKPVRIPSALVEKIRIKTT